MPTETLSFNLSCLLVTGGLIHYDRSYGNTLEGKILCNRSYYRYKLCYYGDRSFAYSTALPFASKMGFSEERNWAAVSGGKEVLERGHRIHGSGSWPPWHVSSALFKRRLLIRQRLIQFVAPRCTNLESQNGGLTRSTSDRRLARTEALGRQFGLDDLPLYRCRPLPHQRQLLLTLMSSHYPPMCLSHLEITSQRKKTRKEIRRFKTSRVEGLSNLQRLLKSACMTRVCHEVSLRQGLSKRVSVGHPVHCQTFAYQNRFSV